MHLLLEQEANWQVNIINLKSIILSLHSKKPSEYPDFSVGYTDSANLWVSSPTVAPLLFCFPEFFYFTQCTVSLEHSSKAMRFPPFTLFGLLSHVSQPQSFTGSIIYISTSFLRKNGLVSSVFAVWWKSSISIVWNEMVSLPNHRLVYVSWISQWN